MNDPFATAPTQVPLHAQFVLLAHDGETGKRLIDGQRYKVGIAAAAVAELVLQEALILEGEGRKARLRASGADISEELEEALQRSVGQSPKNAIARIGGGQTFTNRAGEINDAVANELERRGIVKFVEKKAFGLVPTRTMLVQDGSRAEAVERLRRAVDSAMPLDARTATSVTIADAAGVLRKLLPNVSKKDLKARTQQIAAQGWADEAIRKAIQELQSAAASTAIAGGAS